MRSVRSGASVTDGIRIGGGDLDGQLAPADPGQFRREHEQIRTVRQRRERPREAEREVEVVLGIRLVVERDHRVFEAEQHPRVDLERQIQVDRTFTPLLGMEVDLPRLAQ